MSSYTVILNFNDGTYSYDLPYVQFISDPKEGMKATIIEGNRADGVICIPGGKKSQIIEIRGLLWDNDGYIDLDTRIQELKTKVTTNVATLTLKYWDANLSGGGGYVNSWQYTVRRIDEIKFSPSMRTESQEYSVSFLVLAY